MIEIFRHTDEDGDRVIAQLAHNGELLIEAFPTADPGMGYSVYIPASRVRELTDELQRHFPPEPTIARELGVQEDNHGR